MGDLDHVVDFELQPLNSLPLPAVPKPDRAEELQKELAAQAEELIQAFKPLVIPDFSPVTTMLIAPEEAIAPAQISPEKELAPPPGAEADPEELEAPLDRSPEPSAPPPALSNEEVTGHTASLWKYLPVPQTEPEPAPEYQSGTSRYPGSTVIGARVRGKKHKHEGTNCDDWYETACLEDITFIALSDGAGSKRFSRIGARVSCKVAAGCLMRLFEAAMQDKPALRADLNRELSDPVCMEACRVLAGAVQQAVQKAADAVEAAYYARVSDRAYELALGRKLALKDFSGTLLLAAVVPLEGGERLVLSCQIGDGMIALLDTKGPFDASLKLMGVPDSGDFSGETEFLTSPAMRRSESLQTRTKISRGRANLVLVMSDGVADDYFPHDTEMRRLYFDLVANGILEADASKQELQSLSPQQWAQMKKIPSPLAYPWVNDQSVQVPLQYTSRLCEAAGLTLSDLWANPGILHLAQLEVARCPDPGEQLKVWLDNYVERGSFDDRTLVIAKL